MYVLVACEYVREECGSVLVVKCLICGAEFLHGKTDLSV